MQDNEQYWALYLKQVSQLDKHYLYLIRVNQLDKHYNLYLTQVKQARLTLSISDTSKPAR